MEASTTASVISPSSSWVSSTRMASAMVGWAMALPGSEMIWPTLGSAAWARFTARAKSLWSTLCQSSGNQPPPMSSTSMVRP
jgi:hypothetical protein